MSFQQATFHGVPMIVVPIWGDQTFVAHSVEYQGNGIHLELTDINTETLTAAFRDILDNEKYIMAAKEVSRRFKDRPMSAVDTAVWWTEYVLRHDTTHLKSPGIWQYWWQRRLIDFWATIFIGILLTALITVKITTMSVRKLIRVARNSHGEKAKQT
jgi:glucuronosyltransferase